MWVAELGACARAQSDAADHLYHAFGTWSEVVEVAGRDRVPAALGRPDSLTPEKLTSRRYRAWVRRVWWVERPGNNSADPSLSRMTDHVTTPQKSGPEAY